MSQLSAFTSMSAHSFLCKEQHIDWRNLTVTWKRGGLGTRLQFECMLAVHTDQRLHSSLMHDFINTWTTRPCIYIKNTLVNLCCWRGHKFRPFYLKHLSCCMEVSGLWQLTPPAMPSWLSWMLISAVPVPFPTVVSFHHIVVGFRHQTRAECQ